MLERVRDHRTTVLEKRAQSISWVVGQLMCDRDYADEWELRRDAAAAWERAHA